MEYEAMANDFLNNHNATVDIEFREEVYSPWGDNRWHNAYDVTIERNGESFTVDFKGSAYSRDNGIEPTAYDILACLQKYEVETYKDFCSEYGYDGSEESLDIYHKCKEEYENVYRLFADCMEELQEIC